ncbi:S41 family peptidase [Kordiimonas sp.]|uniref:S41 family peptidase n=1 Tax=Kordiimonas sp. TaxID=1970157 RepID=UPI003B51B626
MTRLRGAFSALILSTTLLAGAAAQGVAADGETLLLREPSVSKDKLAFVYAGDIWIADRDGKDARRLTSHPADEGSPHLSPDGKWVAFTAEYGNNADVYVISAGGGQPKRLTYHPEDDVVQGWNVSGGEVLFTSRREVAIGRSAQAYQVSTNGGYPVKVMDALVAEGTWSPDGKRLAYRPHTKAYRGSSGWRQHRGGTTPPVWLYDITSGAWEEIPHENASDSNPIWLGDKVYFVSDRADGAANLFEYDTRSKAVKQLTENSVWDIRNASGYGDKLVYEAGGRLYEMKTSGGRAKEIKISIKPDLPQLQPGWKDASRSLENAALSPTGTRAIVTARGDIFTVPTEDGSTRNITATDGVRESAGLWSPKGGDLAYISDEGGVHRLVIADQTGMGESRTLDLGDTGYYDLLLWGGDGSRIIYSDNHLNLFAIDVTTGDRTLIDTDERRSGFGVSLSKDGRWLAYTKTGANYFGRIMLHDFESGESVAVTDGLSHADAPAFSPDGKYLYFAASTNSGPSQVGLDMSTQERPLRFGLYVAILQADGASPMLPKPGDETVKTDETEDTDDKDTDEDSEGNEASEGEDKADEPKVPAIDLEGLTSRIIALPVAEKAYDSLEVASDGALFFMERRQPGVSRELPDTDTSAVDTLMRFNFKGKDADSAFDRVSDYSLSADGKKLLVMGAGGRLMVADAGARPQGNALNMSDVKSYVNPRAEWAQIFTDVWRMEQEYFYDPNLHGIDWQGVYDRYRPLVDHVGRREDLNELMVEMIGELQVGHNRVGGGDVHRERGVGGGLLGADLAIEDGRYRIKKIYTGERWNPFLTAPLAIPGIGANEGDFILAVNGRTLTAGDNINAFLEGTAGKQVTLKLAKSADGADARDIVVEPIDDDSDLRHWAWVESRRKQVENATDGKVAYVYLPNTAGAGFTYFNRMFFAQVDKKAIIVDERQNSGGQAANYITDVLSRTYLSSWKDRDGLTFDTPGGAIYGPKVMLIDQDAGSGGDFLPYAFSRMGLGKLVGKRTWGGLIGISANPGLVDGGWLAVPFFRFYTPDGEWRVENEGVSPDIEIEQAPDAINAGRDPQLERAIEEILKDLEAYTPIKRPDAPAMPTELGK